MARKRYPSDGVDRRRAPYAKVYLRARSHPRTARAMADPEMRGILTGLWMLGQSAHAGDRGDELVLTHGELVWLTGRAQFRHAASALRVLCELVEYSISVHDDHVVVHVANLAENQIGAPQTPAGRSAQLRASETPKPRSTEAPKRSARSQPQTDAPEELTTEDAEKVRAYFAVVSPDAVSNELDARIESALLFFGKAGRRHRDWARAVIDNIVANVNRERARDGKSKLASLGAARKRAASLERLRAPPPVNGSLPFKPLTDHDVEALIET